MADYPPYPIAVLQNLKNMKKKKVQQKWKDCTQTTTQIC